ncbi:MAG: glycosyltransferase family 2 protein [Gemmatimonadaceae bacterium]|nr:glycosyltransferase family 2 protein [Gemmatimonadaceae bacterium]
MTSPTISLVIATYNWPSALDVILKSVRAQTSMPLEVLVADDGSRDETREVVQAHQRDFPTRLVHIWHEDTGFRLGAIRNRAMAEARGEYLVQIDGDIVLHPRFIAAHASFAKRGTYAQGSRCLLSEALTQQVLTEGRAEISLLERGLRNRQNAFYLPWLTPLVGGPTDPDRATRGCHMAFWRDDIVAANGYDEAIHGWGREDSELAARLINRGLTRRNFKFSAIAFHLWHRERGRDAFDRNHAIYEETVRSGRTRCDVGIAQYLNGGRSDAAHGGESHGGESHGGESHRSVASGAANGDAPPESTADGRHAP